ncbi:hypothetical protein VDT1_1427 [Vibrio sp. 16]|nr:hypothetical protein VDT1_1427 [Vibrio sp. 16]
MHPIVTLHQQILNPEKTKVFRSLMPWSHWWDKVVLLSIFYTSLEAIIKYGKRSKKTAGNLCPSVR